MDFEQEHKPKNFKTQKINIRSKLEHYSQTGHTLFLFPFFISNSNHTTTHYSLISNSLFSHGRSISWLKTMAEPHSWRPKDTRLKPMPIISFSLSLSLSLSLLKLGLSLFSHGQSISWLKTHGRTISWLKIQRPMAEISSSLSLARIV